MNREFDAKDIMWGMSNRKQLYSKLYMSLKCISRVTVMYMEYVYVVGL